MNKFSNIDTKDFEYLYTKPEPSLCDSCKFAYFMSGGSVSIGSVSNDLKMYRQRYCNYPIKGNISISGYQECELYGKL